MSDNLLQITLKRERKFGDQYKEEYAYNLSQLLSDIGGLL